MNSDENLERNIIPYEKESLNNEDWLCHNS